MGAGGLTGHPGLSVPGEQLNGSGVVVVITGSEGQRGSVEPGLHTKGVVTGASVVVGQRGSLVPGRQTTGVLGVVEVLGAKVCGGSVELGH